jgi:4-hydroxy-L-threonine phosphate dehydrogenase PdxA
MLYVDGKDLRVGLLTDHIPLNEVAAHLEDLIIKIKYGNL